MLYWTLFHVQENLMLGHHEELTIAIVSLPTI